MYRNLISLLIGCVLLIGGCSLSTTKTQPNKVSAQQETGDYRQWHLPEGAKIRLGKGGVRDMEYSLEGSLLAVASKIGVWIYDATTYTERQLLVGHTDTILNISFSPSGDLLAGGCWDGTLHLWDVVTGKHVQTLGGEMGYVIGVCFSPDGSTLASSDRTKIRLWDVGSEKRPRTFARTTYFFTCLSFSPDGKMLAAGSSNKAVYLWDVASGELLHTLETHSDAVRDIAFSPDGKTLVSSGYTSVRETYNGYVDRSKYSIQLWETATGKHLQTFIGKEGEEAANSVAFSPDGKTLASGGLGIRFSLWDIATGQHLRTIRAHADTVRRVAFSPDGKTLATVSSDGTVLLWDIERLSVPSTSVQSGQALGRKPVPPYPEPFLPRDPKGLFRLLPFPLLERLLGEHRGVVDVYVPGEVVIGTSVKVRRPTTPSERSLVKLDIHIPKVSDTQETAPLPDLRTLPPIHYRTLKADAISVPRVLEVQLCLMQSIRIAYVKTEMQRMRRCRLKITGEPFYLCVLSDSSVVSMFSALKF